MKKLKSVLALILALAMLVPAGMSLADGADSSRAYDRDRAGLQSGRRAHGLLQGFQDLRVAG